VAWDTELQSFELEVIRTRAKPAKEEVANLFLKWSIVTIMMPGRRLQPLMD